MSDIKLTQIEAKEAILGAQATMHWFARQKECMPESKRLLSRAIVRLELVKDYIGKCDMPEKKK